MIKLLRKILSYSDLDAIDIDSDNRLKIHREILSKKKMLRGVFTGFHNYFQELCKKHLSAKGIRLEIGAGVSPMRDSYPDVLASDIVHHNNLDMVIDAQNIEFNRGELSVIIGQNCFHHIPSPERFFSEANRVLKVGGIIILLEPYYGRFASFLFPRMFKTESFDKKATDWETLDAGVMNGANQALSYVVLIRDRNIFEKMFPSLRVIDHIICDNHLEYLLSGGLNFKQLVPNFCIPVIIFAQKILKPFNKMFALHHIIVIKKIS